jgi:Holliday junction resolvasome RuvABC endonuclease subunit
MSVIKVLGIDPSLTHTGYAIAEVCTVKRQIVRVIETATIITAPTKSKQVRKSSDDMHRARVIAGALSSAITEHSIKVGSAEIPSGSQSASAIKAFGISIGILASLTIPLIELSPREVKMATVGKATADKEDMVRWAVTKTVNDPIVWNTSKAANDWAIPHGKGFVTKTVEHEADAICGIEAAIKSEQFRQLCAMLQSLI